MPKDAEERRKQDDAKKQRRLDPHLVEKPKKEPVVPYSDNLFRDTAIEWVVSTDQVSNEINLLILYWITCVPQPIQALEHLSFRKLVNIAARATNGVKIPDRRKTRAAIIDAFKQQLTAIRIRLTVRFFLMFNPRQPRA